MSKHLTTEVKNNRMAVIAAFFINGFVFSNWAGRIPNLQSNYDMDNGTLGLVLLSSSIGALIAMPFTGWLISLIGSRQITLISSIAYILVVPLFTLSPNVPVLAFMFLVMGVFTGTMDVAMNAQAVFVEEKYKRPIMSFFHAIFSAGMMIGAGVSALFAYADTSLTFHFSCLLFGMIPLVLWAVKRLVNDAPVKSQNEDKTFFHIPNRALLGIGIIAFCCMLGEGAMSDWSANYMKQIVNAPTALVPIGLFSFSLAMMLGRFFGDGARQRFGDRLLIQIGGILSFIGIAIVILLPFSLTALIGFFIVGIGLSTIVPITYSIAGSLPNLSPGVGIGMVTTIGYSGFIFGPALIGFLAELHNLRIAMFFILGLFAIMILLAFFLKGISNHSKVE